MAMNQNMTSKVSKFMPVDGRNGSKGASASRIRPMLPQNCRDKDSLERSS